MRLALSSCNLMEGRSVRERLCKSIVNREMYGALLHASELQVLAVSALPRAAELG